MGLLRQRDVEVKDFQRHVQEIAAERHEAKSTSRGRHQRLFVKAMEHRYRVREIFETAATQWRVQTVKFAVKSIDHVLQDSCKSDREGDGAGSSQSDSAVG